MESVQITMVGCPMIDTCSSHDNCMAMDRESGMRWESNEELSEGKGELSRMIRYRLLVAVGALVPCMTPMRHAGAWHFSASAASRPRGRTLLLKYEYCTLQ